MWPHFFFIYLNEIINISYYANKSKLLIDDGKAIDKIL